MEKVRARVNRRLRLEFEFRRRASGVAFPVSMPQRKPTLVQRLVKRWFHA